MERGEMKRERKGEEIWKKGSEKMDLKVIGRAEDVEFEGYSVIIARILWIFNKKSTARAICKENLVLFFLSSVFRCHPQKSGRGRNIPALFTPSSLLKRKQKKGEKRKDGFFINLSLKERGKGRREERKGK